MLPRIGVSGSIVETQLPGGTRRTFLNEPYVQAVQEAGGLPLIVTPAHGGPALRELYELFDGLLLTGGEDVAPERYGESVAHPSVHTQHAFRVYRAFAIAPQRTRIASFGLSTPEPSCSVWPLLRLWTPSRGEGLAPTLSSRC